MANPSLTSALGGLDIGWPGGALASGNLAQTSHVDDVGQLEVPAQVFRFPGLPGGFRRHFGAHERRITITGTLAAVNWTKLREILRTGDHSIEAWQKEARSGTYIARSGEAFGDVAIAEFRLTSAVRRIFGGARDGWREADYRMVLHVPVP